MKYCAGDVEFYYEMIGQGKPILMLNGYFNDLRAWKGCIEPIFENKSNYQSC
ncbi:MAG: hypothetical protein KAX49_10750 [Halanaerobiales bacterium]|nr:hypothetical protein [Halanaerobiales bacterium]